VTSAPKFQILPTQVPCVNFSIETQQSGVSPSGETKISRDFARVVGFGEIAQYCFDHFQAGNLVYVNGRLKTRKWTDSNQSVKYITETHVKEAWVLENSTQKDDTGFGDDLF